MPCRVAFGEHANEPADGLLGWEEGPSDLSRFCAVLLAVVFLAAPTSSIGSP